MCELEIDLPELILLEQFNGDYKKYIDAIYLVFQTDFIKHKTKFRGEDLRFKWAPLFQNKPCTFYHLTHKGEDEQNREPDLRRCERLPWAKPVIENCDKWKLKIWPQERRGANRLCIWLELDDEPDYFIILDVRDGYKLLWTAFVAQYSHEKKKKLREYEEWLKKTEAAKKT